VMEVGPLFELDPVRFGHHVAFPLHPQYMRVPSGCVHLGDGRTVS